MKTITDAKLAKYFKVTGAALKKAKAGKKDAELANQFLDMAQRYYSDAKYFKEKGDYVTAFAALNYAHGWLDAGAVAKLFDVKDNKLFTVD